MLQAKAVVVKGDNCYVHTLSTFEEQMVKDITSRKTFEVSGYKKLLFHSDVQQ